MGDAPPLLQVTDVARSFPMGDVQVQALREVNLEVQSGEILVLLGPSGCGKSTLLNLLGGTDKADHGSVRFQGKALESLGEYELTMYRRNHIGFIFQFYNLIPSLTAIENVQVAGELSRNPLDAYEVMARVGLSDRCDHFPSQLSGGEQQRVAIARSLVSDPDILLCDEPTGALDLATSRRVLRILVEANQSLNKTIVLVTHNSTLAQLAHRVAHLRDGKIVSMTLNPKRTLPEDVTW